MIRQCPEKHGVELGPWYLRANSENLIVVETWVKMDGPPPVDPGELTFLAVDTRAPYTRDYDGAQGGKPAHYMLRWVNSRGEVGPWSATVTATIGA